MCGVILKLVLLYLVEGIIAIEISVSSMEISVHHQFNRIKNVNNITSLLYTIFFHIEDIWLKKKRIKHLMENFIC